jgi:hypothetical protein
MRTKQKFGPGSSKHPVAACAFFIYSALAGYAVQLSDFTYVEYDTYIEITGYPEDATGGVIIPSEIVGKPVTSIGQGTVADCTRLTSVYSEGKAPGDDPSVFENSEIATVYYLAEATGWGARSGGRPTALSDPVLEILQPPQSYTAEPGSSATLTVLTGGIEGEVFEWKHGNAVVGENSPMFTLSNVQALDAGQYTVTVTASGETVSSRAVTLGVKAPPYDTEKMMNISTRGQILTGTKVMIAGFVLEGSGQKDVLIRGIGPTLVDFGVNGFCTDPKLALFRNTNPPTPSIAENDDWGSLPGDMSIIFQRVGAFALIDGSKDAAIYMALDPGAYTAKVSGLDGTGVGLVELYDADLDPLASTFNLSNISTRGEVGIQAQILIAGFVVTGEVPKQVLVRGIGPRLADFDVEDTLVDPYLRIVKNVGSDQLWVASNDNWSDNPNAADIVTTSTAVGAFDLTDGSKDAAMLTWLERGVYTAQLSGVGETTGVALVEVYEVPVLTNQRPISDTVALWLFDEIDYPHATLTDASDYAKADLRLMDGGHLVSGKFGNALRLSGTDFALCYAEFVGTVDALREPNGIPSSLWGPTEGPGALLEGLAGDEWTIEFWLNPESVTGDSVIIDMGQAYEPGFTLSLTANGFELVNYFAGIRAVCPADVSAGQWQHVAITRADSEVRCFLNGEREARIPGVYLIETHTLPDLQQPESRSDEDRGFLPMSFEQRRLNRFNLAIGTDRKGIARMKGLIDEMRISRVARFSADFDPESCSENFGPNASEPPVANGPALLFDPGPVTIPLEFGARKHVFIDDAIIDTQANLQITMNQPFRKEEIGREYSGGNSSVFDVDGVIFMASTEGYNSDEGLTLLETSEDGLSFAGKGSIIQETPMHGSFFRDLNPSVPAREIFKANARVASRGVYFYTSGDGINWRRNEVSQLPLVSGGAAECFWDDQRGRYASYIKRDVSYNNEECPRVGARVGVGFWTKEILKPWPFDPMDSPYFEHSPFPCVTCEGPISFGETEAGQVYRTRAIKYPWAADVYLAFIWRFDRDNDEVRHVDLGISRDGETWSFFGKDWYIPLGSREEEITFYGLIRRGNEIWQYVEEGGAHGRRPREYYRYTQRLDGFVSLDAGAAPGIASTLPLVFEGDQLLLNLIAQGSARVAIADADGTPIPGYGLDDCDSITGDFVDRAVTWHGLSNVAALAGTPVRLIFEMQNTKLYAFEFATLQQ